MLKEFFDHLITFKRETILPSSVGPLLYSDSHKEYKPLIKPINRTVSNLESLIKVVFEEAERRNNPEGRNMTLIFDKDGATFWPDDITRTDSWIYRRSFTDQWLKFQQAINKQFDHVGFLRTLQALKPSILGYQDFSRDFRKVNISAGESISSAPILEDGNAGSAISFTVQASSGISKTSKLPAEIRFSMPIVKNDLHDSYFEAEIDASLTNDKENKESKIKLSMMFFETDIVIEDLIKNEIEKFVSETQEMDKLLILCNL